jgi:hypothetical protein
MECLGLHNKPKAEVHLGHKLTGPKEVEVEDYGEVTGWGWVFINSESNTGSLSLHNNNI